jgi:hypothetical protein
VYQGVAFQLTLSQRISESSMPPAAATRVNRPSTTPTPTAVSANAMASPKAVLCCCTGPRRPPIGLSARTAVTEAYRETGEDASRKRASATLEMPA